MLSFAENEFTRIENGWILYNESEYYFSNASSSAERAWEFCKKQHADLVVIESESERQFLWKYVRNIWNICFLNQI